jgi:mRNA interferase RelE/StbE
MASYELAFKRSVAKDLRALPMQDVRRILSRVRALAEDPRPAGCEKLSGRELYRIRQGKYRIVYAIADTQLVVQVIKIAHRRDAYRDR